MGSGSVTVPAKRMPDPNTHSLKGPSKRFKKPSSSSPAAAALAVPPGHVSFRLLCHASRIGGVIGRSGSVIKQLQQATGAKIRVEIAPAEVPDRIITVVAASAPAAVKIALRSPIGSGHGDGENEEMEVSKAQEALLRVFDRILEVAAESGAVGVGVGVVSCRMLADVSQAGSVIGKGGKIVEKIRKDSGTKIRVLKEKLPACAASTDEMIEIEGDVLAVKKALVAVSLRIQDCPKSDKTRVLGSRHLETVPQETLPVDLHVGHISQRHSVIPTLPSSFVNLPSSSINIPSSSILQTSSINLPSSSIGYASVVHPLSIESEMVPILNTKTQKREIVFKILCANDKVGGVIGKGGAIVKALQSETGATVSVGAFVAECDERLIMVTASENPESRYSPAQRAVVLVFSRSIDGGTEKGQESGSRKGSSVTARLVVPTNQVGCLMGKGGTIVSEIRKVTGANIRVLGGNQVPKCVSENDGVVQISGDFSSVQDALYNATGRLRDNLLSSIVKSAGARCAPSLLADTATYERTRDPAPLGISVSPTIGVNHNIGLHPTRDQSLDHLGLSYTLDRPPSPRAWTSQMVAGVSTRGIPNASMHMVAGVSTRGNNDAGRGLASLKGGLELSSGSKTAIVTNTTVEIVVPENVIGSVYGENGNNLTRLRQISGARVIVHEPHPDSSDRIIVISGTPDETQAAQSLLHAFILTGPS